MIDRKLEPLVKRQMTKYLGELEDDDLIMFVLEHLKDHKSPSKLVEGLEPVRRHGFLILDIDVANAAQLFYRYWKKRPRSLQSRFGGKSFLKAWRMAKACILKE
jgi:hypothetical protein